MSKFIEYLNGNKFVPLFFMGTLIVVFFVIFCFIHYSDGDDAIFAEMTLSRSYLEYLKFRYETWTGRMGGESLAYLVFNVGGIWFWRIINALMVVILPLLILKLSTLSLDSSNIRCKCNISNSLKLKNWDILRLLVVLFSGYLLMDVMTFGHSAVWVNGSLFYTWSIVFGLFSLIPSVKYFYGLKFKTWELAYAIPCSLIASMSVEQIGGVLFTFIFALLIAGKLYKKQIHWGVVVQLTLIIISMAVLVCAPGNESRIDAVFAGWLTPEYLTINTGHHLFITYQWLISSFANEGRLLFLCIWIAGLLLLAEQGKCLLRWIMPILLFGIIALLPFAKITGLTNVGLDDINPAVALDILPTWQAMTLMNAVALFGWTIALMFTFVFLWNVSKSFKILLVFITAIASECIMYFSPTIYASGERVYFITSLLFMFIMSQFWLKMKSENSKNLYVIIVFLLGILNVLNQTTEIIQKIR